MTWNIAPKSTQQLQLLWQLTMRKHQQISASTLCKFLLQSTMVDAVLAAAEAVRGTGSPQSSEFSLLLAKCLMSTPHTLCMASQCWNSHNWNIKTCLAEKATSSVSIFDFAYPTPESRIWKPLILKWQYWMLFILCHGFLQSMEQFININPTWQRFQTHKGKPKNTGHRYAGNKTEQRSHTA